MKPRALYGPAFLDMMTQSIPLTEWWIQELTYLKFWIQKKNIYIYIIYNNYIYIYIHILISILKFGDVRSFRTCSSKLKNEHSNFFFANLAAIRQRCKLQRTWDCKIVDAWMLCHETTAWPRWEGVMINIYIYIYIIYIYMKRIEKGKKHRPIIDAFSTNETL